MNIFAIPYAGGNCYCYRDLAKACSLGCAWETLELPGRGKRPKEPLLDSIEAMASDVVKQIYSRDCEVFKIFGHSMGGLVAHRAVQIIEQQHLNDLSIDHLFVSGCRAPGLKRLKAVRSPLSRAELISAIDSLGGLPREIREDADLMGFFEPILRADFSAVDRYRPSQVERIHTPITVFSGKNDSEVNAADVAAWRETGSQPARFFSFPGNHFFFLDHISQIASVISGIQGGGESSGTYGAND
jgi:surfactin synthase thioesterase subunit